MTAHTQPPGYRLGDPSLPRSPVTLAELDEMKGSVLFGDDDVAALRQAGDILEPQVEDVLDVWYGFVGDTPHLLAYFSKDGVPDGQYLDRVRARFAQWVLDTCRADYDEAWLAYQHEIGRRHHRAGKNQTDGAQAVDHIAFRHVLLLTYPIFATLRPFLEKGDASPAQVEAMHQAWLKAVLLQVALWSHPYVQPGDH